METSQDFNPMAIIAENVDNIAVARLLQRIMQIEANNDADNVEEYDALNHAVSFLLDTDFMIAWSSRDINKEWLDTVVAAPDE